jgi:hypothetical protein
MGDWAERALAEALVRSCQEWKVVQYGDTNRVAAGDPEFKTSYLAGLEETRQFGKRPDLLIFPASFSGPADLSLNKYLECEPVAMQSIAGVEVRSSKVEALRYMSVRQRQQESGKLSGRKTPSFTVKVEDLVIVYRWLERCGVPESYCQVFFDSIFAINFLSIFRLITTGAFSVETPKKSQEKNTIMIPITSGVQIGRATSMPTFTARHRVTELGRHDAYVVPEGGGFQLDVALTKKVLLAES